ncbi:MAG: DUF1275 family protein, partial [Phycisphaerales bacterium]
MFASKAHSVAQQARLAITLAWVAGYTNIVTILTCDSATSHVSGTASQFGRHGVEFEFALAARVGWVLAAFTFGAALSGFSTHIGRRFRWSSIYVLPMAVEGLLLTGVFGGVFNHQPGTIESGWSYYALTGLAA